MSQFPGQGSLRTLGLEIHVSLKGGETFDRLEKLISRVNEQVAKINAGQGQFVRAFQAISARITNLRGREFAPGADQQGAQSSLNQLTLVKQVIQRQYEAQLVQELRLRGNLQVRLGQELTVLGEINKVQGQIRQSQSLTQVTVNGVAQGLDRQAANARLLIQLDTIRLDLLRKQAQAEAQTLIGRARQLEGQGRRQEAVTLLSGALTQEQDPHVKNRLMAEHLRLQKAVTKEIDGQKGFIATIVGGFGDVLKMLTKIQAVFLVFRATFGIIGGAINDLVFRPLIGLTREVLTVTDAFRKFENTFAGISGSLRTSRDIVRDIVKASEGLPITPRQALESIRMTAFVPAISSRLANPAGRQEFSAETLRTIVGLGTINPTQGPEGAGFAIREALAGQFRSIRTRFDISPDVIAATIGKRLDDLRRDPELTLKAITAFTDSFVGPEVFEQMKNTLSTQGSRFRGLLEQFFRAIGEVKIGGQIGGQPGLFDSVVGRFRAFNDAFNSFLNPEKGTSDAADLKLTTQRVSAALQQFIDAILGLASSLISGLTGQNIDLKKAIDANDFKRLGDVFASVIEGLGKLSAFLIGAVGSIADALAYLAGLLLPDPETERRNLRMRALGVEDADGQLVDRSFRSDNVTQNLVTFDVNGRPLFQSAASRVRFKPVPPEAVDAVPLEQVIARAQAQQARPSHLRFIDEAGIRRLRAVEERAALQAQFLSITKRPDLSTAAPEVAPVPSLDDQLNELGKRVTQTLTQMSSTLNLQREAAKQDEASDPRTIGGAAADMRRAIQGFAGEGRSSLQKLTDEANRLKAEFEGQGFFTSEIAGEQIDTRLRQINAGIVSAVRTGIQNQVDVIEQEIKSLPLEGQISERRKVLDELLGGGGVAGGTGLLGAIPDEFLNGRNATVLAAALGANAGGVLESAQAENKLRSLKAGGLEDVGASVQTMQRAVTEIDRLSAKLEAIAGQIVAESGKNVLETERNGLAKVREQIEAELLALQRRQEDIAHSVQASIVASQRSVVDATLAARERALESIESEPARIAAKTALAIEKIGDDAKRQLDDLNTQFKALVAKHGGGMQGFFLAVQDAQARAEAIESARDIQTKSAQGAGDVEALRVKRRLIELRSQIAGDSDVFFTERERVIEQTAIKRAALEVDLQNELNEEIKAGIQERIRITKLGGDLLVRATEEVDAKILAGRTQQLEFNRLFGERQRDIRSSIDAGGPVGRAPRNVQELQKAFQEIEAQREGAVRAGDLGLSGGLSNRQAMEQAISQYTRLRELVLDPKYQSALGLEDIDVARMEDKFAEALAGVREQFDITRVAARQLQADIAGAFKGMLGDTVIDIIKNKGENLADIFENIGLRIVRALADAIEEILILENLKNFLRLAFAPGTTGTGAGTGPTVAGGQGGLLGGLTPTGGAQGMFVNAAEGYGILSRTNGLVTLADGRIARTVEDGRSEAIIPMPGGGVPVRIQRMFGQLEAHIPLPSAPGGRIPVRLIESSTGTVAMANGGYAAPSMASFAPRMPIVGTPAPAAREAANQREGDLVLNIVNTAEPEAMVRRAAATDPNTFVNPVVNNSRGRGAMRRTIRSSR